MPEPTMSNALIASIQAKIVKETGAVALKGFMALVAIAVRTDGFALDFAEISKHVICEFLAR
jgi:hypothetical protein